MNCISSGKLEPCESSGKFKQDVVVQTVSCFCKYCGSTCQKSGIRNGNQQFKCKSCGRYQRQTYKYNAYHINNQDIIRFVKEGVGMRSTARLLRISLGTLIRRIKKIAKDLKPKSTYIQNLTYQVDELRTFIKKKSREIWVTYAMCQETKEIVGLSIGRRTIKKLKIVIDSILPRNPKMIFTDKLVHYHSLIPQKIHKTQKRCTSHIERFHLNLRTHLKRLNRKTICFSKSVLMLESCLKIYFWG